MYVFRRSNLEICKQQNEIKMRHLPAGDQREMEICKQWSEIEMRHLPAISIYGQSIGIDETSKFKLKFCI